MPLEALKSIRFSKDEVYKKGEILPEMNMLEASRLIELKAAMEVEYVEKAPKKEKLSALEAPKPAAIIEPVKTEPDKTPDKDNETEQESIYADKSYVDLRKIAKQRGITLDKNTSLEKIIILLEADDQREFDEVVAKLKAKNIPLPASADIEELEELLEGSEDDTQTEEVI